MKQKNRGTLSGFTLIELLVVIAVIGLLASIIIVSMNSVRVKARDTARKSNLKQMAKALEVYYNDHGYYPTTTGWRGAATGWGGYPDTGSNAWIPGDFTPKYIARLPYDPMTMNSRRTWGCDDKRFTSYIYKSDGKDFKVAAKCLPEQDSWDDTDPFYDYDGRYTSWSVYSSGAKDWPLD